MLVNRRTFSMLDHHRLITAVDEAQGSWATYAPKLSFFRAELRHTQPVHPADVPRDAITMNSRFALRSVSTGETISYELVYPEDAAPRDGEVSVLSPMGMALLGARVGDHVCWDSAHAPEVARIERLHYQPEARKAVGAHGPPTWTREHSTGGEGDHWTRPARRAYCDWTAERKWEDDGGRGEVAVRPARPRRASVVDRWRAPALAS
jgi:regulator of nucleoside diphosphate kinase